jgi:hypothetical protein
LGERGRVMQPPIFGSNKVETPFPSNGSPTRVFLLWEYTQAFIAGAIVASTVIIALKIGLYKNELSPTLSDALLVIVGFYFGRASSTMLHKGK